jgi:hypothetical protein
MMTYRVVRTLGRAGGPNLTELEVAKRIHPVKTAA